ncbi:MAG TPA: AAA domain-containing protein [Ktedonobacteraceae bacterium]|nr:AAA domain-containing protein [Ktedonobacteraceae bacterium]
MAIHYVHDVATSGKTQRACFLCALDPQRQCCEQRIEGRIVAVAQRTPDGARTPIIVLDCDGERVELRLSGLYYHSLVKEISARIEADRAFLHRTPLTLRAYHLPAPTTVAFRDTVRRCYEGNSYTLAVLEPDILLNITDLSQAEYCQRQYLLGRLSPSPASAATMRGNLIHYCFKELLKEHDPGRLQASRAAQETPLETLRRHLDEAIQLNSLELALANISASEMRAEVEPHLESLARWYESKRSTLWDMLPANDDNPTGANPTGANPSNGDDHLALTGDHLALTGDHLALTGDHLALTGDHLALTGDHLALTGDHLALTGDHLAPTGKTPARGASTCRDAPCGRLACGRLACGRLIEGGANPANPANPAGPANPADPADPADPAGPAGPAGPQPDQSRTSEGQVRAETFLLAPEIGLRGRLDLFWQQAGQRSLLELKTGGKSGHDLPRREHRWQVYGYHALLAVRRDSRMKKAAATLLYSGTPGQAQDFPIPGGIREIQRVNERRNLLIISHITGMPPAPPQGTRCTKCSMLSQCQSLSPVLGWQPPQPAAAPQPDIADQPGPYHPERSEGSGPTKEERVPVWRGPSAALLYAQDDVSEVRNDMGGTPLRNESHGYAQENDIPGVQDDRQAVSDAITTSATVSPARFIDTEEDRLFFATYYRLLHLEGRAGEQQQALLWNTPVAERIARGTALYGLEPLAEPRIDRDGWQQSFSCNNTSELREGDEILLSDGDPISGEVVSGTIMQISATRVTVWTRELLAHPALIDRYENDLVHVRTLQNLLRWLQVGQHAPHLRDLVAGKVRPRFIDEDVPARADFNAEQNLAVARAMQMQDYLLIHGPPGTGKTSVIAEIVRRLCARGQRVMLAAFTNQAVDNMLKRLDKEGFHDYLRLGHERSVDEAVQGHLLKALLDARQDGASESYAPEAIYDLLHNIPVVASTTATWSSDKYSFNGGGYDSPEAPDLYFDVAIIDEAGQLTVPAILGALRFARRFILVGDEKQLPPLVLSAEAARGSAKDGKGLADSLFSILKRHDEDYIQRHPMQVSACVPLCVQYRMNRWIANFSSTVFYDKRLIAHESVAGSMLALRSVRAGEAQLSPEIARAIEPRRPLVFLDVHDEPGEVAMGDGKTSNAEARVLRAIVAELLARGIAPGDIGIIAPYRAQVANIRRHLFSDDDAHGWRALAADAGLCVDTVDRFQGGERMVMMISFATASEPEEGSQRREFLVNEKRLNVALTRAQRKLILVGCVPALERLPILSRLITYCRSMNTVIPYRDISPSHRRYVEA